MLFGKTCNFGRGSFGRCNFGKTCSLGKCSFTKPGVGSASPGTEEGFKMPCGRRRFGKGVVLEGVVVANMWFWKVGKDVVLGGIVLEKM